ncbi:hypothetical protein BE04_19450 [Sorangium cellulosum]|uniref:Uncharacterized protein n=2 Tax=Sorangium cellulosum TaxID=56 RepID=A0A150PK11_SORCE|nr:hypothetical protein SCE1572_01485 [Sorangium cellulosum So0157-2]KYF55788.1 hypothetical protein BE04_19450 [Sorangium cellulosum]
MARSEVPWGDKDVYLMRLPFNEEAPVAAGVVPMHNLIETSASARQVTAEMSPSISLVCADVAFSDLAPPVRRRRSSTRARLRGPHLFRRADLPRALASARR